MDEDESSKTTAWVAQRADTPHAGDAPLHFDDSDDGLGLPRTRAFRLRWIGVAGAFGILVVVAIVVLTTDGRSAKSSATPVANSAASPSDPGESWWAPPSGKQVSIEAHSKAFPVVDERSLGAFFDKDLKPLNRAGTFFEQHTPRRFARGEMTRSMITLENKLQLRAGFDAVLAQAGTTYSSDRSYLLYRAFHIAEVLAADESKRMREPPPEAIFYLAEVHRGWSYDLFIEGAVEEVGAELSAFIEVGTVSAQMVMSSFKVAVHQDGLGLEANAADAVFAMNQEQVRSAYKEMDEPVPVKLVFRTIPGRGVKEAKLPKATVVADEQLVLTDGASEDWDLEPGRYRIKASSDRKGINLKFEGGSVACKPRLPSGNEYLSVNTTCRVDGRTTLRVTNYHRLIPGDDERATVFVARLP